MKVAYNVFYKSSFKDAILISEHKEKINDSYMKTKYRYNNNKQKKITILKTTVTAHGRQGRGSCELTVRCVTGEGSQI